MTNKVTFAQAISLGFKNYARFRGVASRSEYWYFVLFYFLLNLVLSTIDSVLAVSIDLPLGLADLSVFVFLLPLLTITARRFKDAGFSAYLIWLQAVPVAAALALVFIVAGDPAVQQMIAWALSDYQPTETEIEQLLQTLDPNIGWTFLATILTSLAWSVFQLVVTVLKTKTREQGNRFAPEVPSDFNGTTA